VKNHLLSPPPVGRRGFSNNKKNTMKILFKTIFTVAAWLLFATGHAQQIPPKKNTPQKTAAGPPMVTADSLYHTFGTIPQGKPVTHRFVLINNGKALAVLNDITTPCGCTTPIWQKGIRLRPGQSTPVLVSYDAASPGPFSKTLTVYYNEAYMLDIGINGVVLTKQ
jgi:hypothetical protein